MEFSDHDYTSTTSPNGGHVDFIYKSKYTRIEPNHRG